MRNSKSNSKKPKPVGRPKFDPTVDLEGRRLEAWRLKVVERRSPAEIAAMLEISLSQVYRDVASVYNDIAAKDHEVALLVRPQAQHTLDHLIRELLEIIATTKATDPKLAISAAAKAIDAQMAIAELYGLTTDNRPALIMPSAQEANAPLPMTLEDLQAMVQGDINKAGGYGDSAPNVTPQPHAYTDAPLVLGDGLGDSLSGGMDTLTTLDGVGDGR